MICVFVFAADVDDTWSIAEAARKFQSPQGRRNEWLVAFKEGVDISEKEIQDTFGQQTEQDFIARYDLSFLTPRSQAIRCKVCMEANSCGFALFPCLFRWSVMKNKLEKGTENFPLSARRQIFFNALQRNRPKHSCKHTC